MITTKLLLAYLLQTANITGIDVDSTKFNLDEVHCLAKNIYYEASGEDIRGQFAVASVTLNRVKDSRFPTTICEVVKQTTISNISKKLVCQFSWYCEEEKKRSGIPIRNKDGSPNQPVIDKFQVASMVALAAMSGEVIDVSKGATHFHNPNIVKPAWSNTLQRTARIGNHDFYKLPPVAE